MQMVYYVFIIIITIMIITEEHRKKLTFRNQRWNRSYKTYRMQCHLPTKIAISIVWSLMQ